MQGVTLSKGVRQNLMAMQSTAKMMAETQNHLATGKKVNSALDNPTNFFTASALDSRASDLGNLMDSVGNAVKTLEAANNGIKAITKLVESAQGTARQALQADKGTISNATVQGSGDFTDLDGDSSLVITVDGTESTIELADEDTIDEVITKINDANTGVTASNDDGVLTLTGSDEVTTFTVDSGAADDLLIADDSDSSTRSVTVDSDTRASLEKEYNELLDQIDQLTSDAGFNGNNFLDGDSLKVTFNESGSSTLTISGTDASSSGLGLSEIASGSFQTNEDIDATLDKLDTAMNSLRSTASTFGSNLSTVQTRQDFTENMINTLESGAANLTMADLNQEGANMLALQTRQSLATTAMSMASRADQSVLSLLR